MSGSTVGLFSRVFHPGRSAPGGGLAMADLPPEQHVVQGVGTKIENGVVVVIPPLYHRVVTLRLTVAPKPGPLTQARERLEAILRELDRTYAPTPAGLSVTVAWGRPYFQRFVPAAAERLLPVDVAASAMRGERTSVLVDAVRFPSDPDDVILEQNDVAVLLRGDVPIHIAAATEVLFDDDGTDFWQRTSIRDGFVGGEGIGLPKQRALEAGIAGAESIPDGAELFMGFTSSQKAALGSDRIANFETIPGATDQWPDGYFRYGTTMHVSHLYEDLEAWYGSLTYQERVARAIRPGLEVPPGTQTVPEGPAQIENEGEVERDLAQHGVVGHSAALQPHTRLPVDIIDNYGTFQPQGSAVPQRADFCTLDNPFAWSIDPSRDRMADGPAAGLHFIVFAPSSAGFARARLAMDGRYADGNQLAIGARDPRMGLNAFTHATHRQNFLVPPRAHRSFPLSELL